MENFAKTNIERRTFITGYDIIEDNIIIYTAFNREFKVPYTIENEKKVLEKMQQQIIDAKPLLNSYDTSSVLLYTVAIGNLLNCLAINLSSTDINASLMYIMAEFSTILGVVAFWENEKRKDLMAHVIFSENEELINSYLAKNPDLKGFTRKTKKFINSLPQPPVLTLNDIEDIPLKDIEALVCAAAKTEEALELKLGFKIRKDIKK